MSADSLNRQGVDLFLRGDVEGARLHYLAALRNGNGIFLPALANLAAVEGSKNNLSTAISYTRRVLAEAPGDVAQWNNLGNMLTRLDRFDEAEAALMRAVELLPYEPGVWHNLALLHYRMRYYDGALVAIEKVERLGSRGHQVQNDKAHVMLAQGRLHEGLAVYEARWHTLSHLPPWDFHIAEWKGEDLNGRTLLLHAEQGYGDTIMCARFARQLAALGAHVVLCVPSILVDLFVAQNWLDVSVIAMDDVESDAFDPSVFDFHSPMYSALYWLGLERENISSTPYITIEADASPSADFNVGICWASGKRGNEHDWRRRVTSLVDWLPIAELPGVRLWSLQKGPEEDEIEEIGAEGLIGNTAVRFTDFHATARFIAGLDLVVSVDTAVAHLAGAMGKPTVMLSQFSNCWRWWGIDMCVGQPWYSNMVILRQQVPNDWKSVLKQAPGLVASYLTDRSFEVEIAA